jgi:hypothetical protein
VRRENSIGIAWDLPSRQAPASLPEIEAAKQQQAVQTCWNRERPGLDWMLDNGHFIFVFFT